MVKPFDATTRQIVEVNPQDWLELIGLPRLSAHLIDADLSTVTTDADRILKITELPERLFHFEFESGRDASEVPRRLHRYNALVDSLYKLPVATVVFLLNPQAARVAEVTGLYERVHPDTGDVVKFWYTAVRVWELQVADLLAGGVATLPLALLSQLGNTEPEQVVSAMHKRIVADAKSEDDAEKVLTGAYILAGLRFSDTIVASLFEGIMHMEESSTYQAILRQGEARGVARGVVIGEARGEAIGVAKGLALEARRLLERMGAKRLGTPPKSITEELDAITEHDRLEEMIDRLPDVESWDDLLAIARIDG